MSLLLCLLLSFGYLVTVNVMYIVALPHGAVGWSAICDYGTF